MTAGTRVAADAKGKGPSGGAAFLAGSPRPRETELHLHGAGPEIGAATFLLLVLAPTAALLVAWIGMPL